MSQIISIWHEKYRKRYYFAGWISSNMLNSAHIITHPLHWNQKTRQYRASLLAVFKHYYPMIITRKVGQRIHADRLRLTVAFELFANSPLHNMAITRHWHQHLLLISSGILGLSFSNPFHLPYRSHMTTIHPATNTAQRLRRYDCTASFAFTVVIS